MLVCRILLNKFKYILIILFSSQYSRLNKHFILKYVNSRGTAPCISVLFLRHQYLQNLEYVRRQSIKKPNFWNSEPASARSTLAMVALCSGDFKLYSDASSITPCQLLCYVEGHTREHQSYLLLIKYNFTTLSTSQQWECWLNLSFEVGFFSSAKLNRHFHEGNGQNWIKIYFTLLGSYVAWIGKVKVKVLPLTGK